MLNVKIKSLEMKNNSILVMVCLVLAMSACGQKAKVDEPTRLSTSSTSIELPDKIEHIKKSVEEWKNQLTEDEFYVLRQKGTERAFTGDLWDHKKECIYTCAGCELPLFDSATKFKSGTGWPSFYQPVEDRVIKEESDLTLGMRRVEVLCARCDGHLGHVFNDGPQPTGLRYCINSVSLNYVEKQP